MLCAPAKDGKTGFPDSHLVFHSSQDYAGWSNVGFDLGNHWCVCVFISVAFKNRPEMKASILFIELF